MVQLTIDQEEVDERANPWAKVEYTVISDEEEESSEVKKVKLGNVFQ